MMETEIDRHGFEIKSISVRRCGRAVPLTSRPLDVMGRVVNPLLGAGIVFLVLHLQLDLL